MTNVTIPQEVWDHQVTANARQPIGCGHGFVAGGNLSLLPRGRAPLKSISPTRKGAIKKAN
jgi:hypothetical protein